MASSKTPTRIDQILNAITSDRVNMPFFNLIRPSIVSAVDSWRLEQSNIEAHKALRRITDDIYTANQFGLLENRVQLSYHHNTNIIEGIAASNQEGSQVEVLIGSGAIIPYVKGQTEATVILRGGNARDVVSEAISPYVAEVAVSSLRSELVLNALGLDTAMHLIVSMQYPDKESVSKGPQGSIHFVSSMLTDLSGGYINPNRIDKSLLIRGRDLVSRIGHLEEQTGVYYGLRTVLDEKKELLEIGYYISVPGDIPQFNTYKEYPLLPGDSLDIGKEGLDITRRLNMSIRPLNCSEVFRIARTVLNPILSLEPV